MFAAQSNPNPEVIIALLNAGSNLEARDFLGRTLLMIAARANNSKVITAVLEAGGDPKAKDDAGKTAFDYAKMNYALRVNGSDVYRRLQEASQ